LMLAAVVVYFLPEGLFDSQPEPAAVPAAVPPAPVITSPAASAPVAAAEAASAASEPAAAAAAPGLPIVETVFSAPPAASAVAGLVQVRSSEASWIEARDGRGQLLLSRTVQPGESVGLDGKLPIRLTIGNAAATQLAFRGQAVDLSQRTRDNVARIELQ
jgi:cytoskeleton protein RodZ